MGVLERVCKTCQQPFEIDENEQVFLRQLADRTGHRAYMPARCLACRKDSRQQEETVTSIVPGGYTISCVDCGDPFEFREQDQRFYLERGFRRPRRCPPCRTKRKSASAGGAA